MRDPKDSSACGGDAGPRKRVLLRVAGPPVSSRTECRLDDVRPEPRSVEPEPRNEAVNTMSARFKETDSLLDSLQRMLSAQAASCSPGAKNAVLEGVLSGATVTRIGRRRAPIQERSVKDVRRLKSQERTQIARQLSKVEEIVSLAQSLGVDVSRVCRESSYAKAALIKGELAKARRWAASADHHAGDAVSQGFPLLLRRSNASLKQLEGMSGCAGNVKQLLEEAAGALKKGDHTEALLSLADARERIRRAEDEVVLRIIADAKNEFVKAKKAGLNIDEAVGLLNRSRDGLRLGQFSAAVKYAKESRKLVERALERHREIQFPFQECVKAVRLAEALGADVRMLDMMLAEARQLYRRNDLERSAKRFKELLELARKTAYGKAAESYELAEKALTLAKKTVGDVPESKEKLRIARELLESDQLAKSVSMSCASMFESDSAIANALADRLKNIDEFARGIERDVDSLTEVREAIESSKVRNLENLRKYASLAEDVVGEAYECAAAYSRVAQDIVKQAYESSLQVSPINDLVGKSTDGLAMPGEIVTTSRQPSVEKRQRLIDMFLTGKVSESQLDKLLLVVDSSIEKDKLV